MKDILNIGNSVFTSTISPLSFGCISGVWNFGRHSSALRRAFDKYDEWTIIISLPLSRCCQPCRLNYTSDGESICDGRVKCPSCWDAYISSFHQPPLWSEPYLFVQTGLTLGYATMTSRDNHHTKMAHLFRQHFLLVYFTMYFLRSESPCPWARNVNWPVKSKRHDPTIHTKTDFSFSHTQPLYTLYSPRR